MMEPFFLFVYLLETLERTELKIYLLLVYCVFAVLYGINKRILVYLLCCLSVALHQL